MKAGYRIEFVMLYGPDRASTRTPPDAPYSFGMMIMSNAAREAQYQRSSGRLKDLSDCTRWKPVHINKERLEGLAGVKALQRLLTLHTICSDELRRMLEDGTLREKVFSFALRLTRVNLRPELQYVTLNSPSCLHKLSIAFSTYWPMLSFDQCK